MHGLYATKLLSHLRNSSCKVVWAIQMSRSLINLLVLYLFQLIMQLEQERIGKRLKISLLYCLRFIQVKKHTNTLNLLWLFS